MLDKTRSVWLTTCGENCKYQRDSWLSCGRRRPALHKEALYCILWQGFLSTLRLLIFVFSQSSFTVQTKYQMLIVVKSSPILEISFFRISSFCRHCLCLIPQAWWKYWRSKLKKCLTPLTAVRNPVGNIFHGKDICQPDCNVLANVLTKMPSLKNRSSFLEKWCHSYGLFVFFYFGAFSVVCSKLKEGF